MSANYNSRKTSLGKTFSAFALITLLAVAFALLPACTPKQPGQKPDEGNDTIILLGDGKQTNVIVILNDSSNIDSADIIPVEINSSEEAPAATQEQPEQNNSVVNASPMPRLSEVEFYFLLTGKFYFKATQKENETKIYNASGELVAVQPIFISKDRVIFKVNNYTTKAIAKDEWEINPGFEILVKDIYYRR